MRSASYAAMSIPLPILGFALGFVLLSSYACAQAPRPADTIYTSGYILTGEGLTSTVPVHVTAMAIRDGLVIAAGSDATVLALKGARTQVIDLEGAFVMPGINDAHTHIASAGRQKLSVDLVGTASLAEMEARIAAAAASKPAGSWLTGGGWDQTKWASKVLPARQDLDRVTGGHPAFFERTDGHIGVANTAALQAGGITAVTPDPQGGRYDHEAGTQAASPLTGILRDTAMEQLEAKIPAPGAELRREALTLALADAAAHGVTSVQDFSDWDDFLALEALERDGRLTARVSEWLTFNDPVPLLESHRAAHSKDDRMLRTGMLKGFMDGSLGSRTAALNAPYSDEPGNSGLARYQQPALDAMTRERMRAGFQIGFHAIGDRAVGMALDAFAAGEAATPGAALMRPRIEHSQVLAAGDFKRYRELGVIASMQPSHLLSDMNWAEARLGVKRVPYSYAWLSFLNHQVPLAFGTDYPVEPVTPFRGLFEATTRASEPVAGAPRQTYFQAERLTIGQAIYAYTQGSAYAEFAEGYKGRLAAGFVADFVVLDRNLLAIAPPEILDTQVLRTVVNGRTVYQAKAR